MISMVPLERFWLQIRVNIISSFEVSFGIDGLIVASWSWPISDGSFQRSPSTGDIKLINSRLLFPAKHLLHDLPAALHRRRRELGFIDHLHPSKCPVSCKVCSHSVYVDDGHAMLVQYRTMPLTDKNTTNGLRIAIRSAWFCWERLLSLSHFMSKDLVTSVPNKRDSKVSVAWR